MASAYTAASLTYGASTNIRVVELLHNGSQDPITCRLHFVALGDQIQYTALSYVWGDPTKTKEIILDGKPFHVRENLWNFLCQARQSKLRGLLWIDAISIDQTNVQERNHQVRMMGEIYSQATLVVVWLGLATKRMAEAIRELSAIYEDKKEPTNWLQACRNINAVCAAEYWTRVWVVQEFVLAKRLVVWCGAEQLQEEALFWLHHAQVDLTQIPCGWSLPSDTYRDLMAHTVHTPALEIIACKLSRSKNPQAMTLIALFSMSQNLGCLDVRDRVYALLSLVSAEEREQWSIVPDYSKPIPQLFEEIYIALQRISTGQLSFQGRSLGDWILKLQKMFALSDSHPVVKRIMAEYEGTVYEGKRTKLRRIKRRTSSEEARVGRSPIVEILEKEVNVMETQLRIYRTILNRLETQGLPSTVEDKKCSAK